MENEKRLEGRTDVLGQYVPPIYIKVEDFEENKQKIDYSQSYVLPTIKTRYISFLIDLISVFLISVGLSKLLSLIISLSDTNRGIIISILILIYEPVLTSFGATIGQLLTNIRVREFKNPQKKINILFAFFRVIVKYLLGIISCITISFSTNRRAIHDYICDSILIAEKNDE